MSIYEQQYGRMSPSSDLRAREDKWDNKDEEHSYTLNGCRKTATTWRDGKEVTRINVKLGFPPRPTTGSAPSLTARDIATPKLNGMRVLMDRNGNVYNRKMQPFTKMDRDTRHEIHDKLLTNSCKYVQWWDMEYVHKDRVAAIIDCCDGSDADYHARRELFDSGLLMNPLEQLDRIYAHPTSGMRKTVWKLPVYKNQLDALANYELMKNIYKNVGDRYLWEGIVAVDTTLPYDLTRTQSMNMEMHRKYRFR